MNSHSLKGIYGVLERVFNYDMKFALGGHYALIKQGTLPERRPIGDLDVNLLVSSSSGFHIYFSKIQETLKMLASIYRTHSSEWNINYDRHTRTEYERGEEDEPIEEDVICSVTIKLIDKVKNTGPKTPPTYEEYLRERTLRDLGVTSQMDNARRAIITDQTNAAVNTVQVVNDTNVQWVVNSTNTVSVDQDDFGYYTTYVSKHDNPKAVRTDDVTNIVFEDIRKNEIINTLNKILLENEGKLKIDFFVSKVDEDHRKFIKVEDELLMLPWIILSAKQRYCTQKTTSDTSFDKHIDDLELSYNAVKIEGVNDPKTIESLIKSR